MKYKTIRMTPYYVPQKGQKWSYNIERSKPITPGTFVNPDPLGFYTYPETMSDKEAFQRLKRLLIMNHNSEISRITMSRNELLRLEFKE